VPELGGVPRPIFSNYDGYVKALEIANSPNVGVCLCLGCWLEGGALMGASALEAIHAFGRQQKLFKVHFRNVNAPLPYFVETFLDDGYADMYPLMRGLQEVGFRGVAIPDHIPRMDGDRRLGTAYTIGYMRALQRRAEEEVGSPRR
jgi:mannonate dehydratase